MVSVGGGGSKSPPPRKHPGPVLKRQLIIRVLILDRLPRPSHRPVGTGRDGLHPPDPGVSPNDEQGRSGIKFRVKHNKNI